MIFYFIFFPWAVKGVLSIEDNFEKYFFFVDLSLDLIIKWREGIIEKTLWLFDFKQSNRKQKFGIFLVHRNKVYFLTRLLSR